MVIFQVGAEVNVLSIALDGCNVDARPVSVGDVLQRRIGAHDVAVGHQQPRRGEIDIVGATGVVRHETEVRGVRLQPADHIARAGVTFKYTDKGPVGLLTGKRAYVFAARGGVYVGTPLDTQTGYVRDFLRFLGITEVNFVYAEGLAISPQSKEAGLAKAGAEIALLAA